MNGVAATHIHAEWNVDRLTVLQVRDWFQNEEPSSKLKSTPPMGAPNAAACKA